MADVFTWLPDERPSGEYPSNVREVRFGDGYRQIAKEGIDRAESSWSLSFDRDFAEAEAIATFLEAHEGEAFLWTPPRLNATPTYFTCDAYRIVPYGGNSSAVVTAQFREFKTP